MENHNKMVGFIWSVADECLRDVYNKGKYRDVILPMVVLRRLDALLEETKEKVMHEYEENLKYGMDNDYESLSHASGYPFYNISSKTLQIIVNNAGNSSEKLKQNCFEYLDGYSENVKEIITKFKLREQIEFMAEKNILLEVLQKFTDKNLNLTPNDIELNDGTILKGVSNLGMGYIFEELIRKFNEENNEEAGEHFTPREVIDLMTHIVFEPIKNKLPGVITIYDPACGSGGMLTESQNFITDEEGRIKSKSNIFLYGKEINDETYAICKSDMMIKNNNPENIKSGSTLSINEFSDKKFDFMLSNPPYGKSWKTEEKFIKDGKDVIDERFIIPLKDFWGNESLTASVPASSDGQLLFLMEMVDKIKTPEQNGLGSKIASVHNGSALFTGDAGSGASNIRRYIIENDMLDCIIQLPTNMFYNTGITTYIWLLNNNKEDTRKEKVLLIDASNLYKKLRKSLGQKNREITSEQIDELVKVYSNMQEVEKENIVTKIFNNSDFGYYKVQVERAKRLKVQFTKEKVEELKYNKNFTDEMKYIYSTFKNETLDVVNNDSEKLVKELTNEFEEITKVNLRKLTNSKMWKESNDTYEVAKYILAELKEEVFMNYNEVKNKIDKLVKDSNIKISTSQKKNIIDACSEYDENADKVIKKEIKYTKKEIDKLMEHNKCTEEELKYYGYYINDKVIITYECETELRDSENISLDKNITEYFKEEVLEYVSDAWIDIDKTKIGYEISFNKYFYKPIELRSSEEIIKDILELEKQSEGLLQDILGGIDYE